MVHNQKISLNWADAFLILLAVFPFVLLLLNYTGSLEFFESSVIMTTLLFMFAATALSFVLSLPLIWSLRKLSRHSIFKYLEYGLLLPQFLPTTFAIAAWLSLLREWPMGYSAVVVLTAIMNAGLIAILVNEGINKIHRGHLEMVDLYLGSPLKRMIFLLGFVRTEIKTALILCATYAWQSFSIPFILGAGQVNTVEISIYEALRVEGNASKAFMLAFVQALVFLLVIWPLSLSTMKKQIIHVVEQKKSKLFSFEHFFQLLPVAVYVLFFTLPLAIGFLPGLKILISHSEVMTQVLNLLLPTFLLGFVFSILMLMFSFLFVSVSDWGLRAARGWTAPGVMLVAFGLVGLLDVEWQMRLDWVLYMSCFVLVCCFSVVKMGWVDHIISLKPQIQAAKLLGASPFSIFSKVVVPQSEKVFSLMVFFSGLWIMGDFALAKILFMKEKTLGLLAANLLSTYYVEAGQVVLTLIFVMGVLQCLLFKYALSWFSKCRS